mgnify:FL=1
MDVQKDEEDKEAAELAKPHMDEMAKRGEPTGTEVEAMLVALYGWLVLRMGGKSVSEDTQESLDVIRDWANILGNRFVRMRAGEL